MKLHFFNGSVRVRVTPQLEVQEKKKHNLSHAHKEDAIGGVPSLLTVYCSGRGLLSVAVLVSGMTHPPLDVMEEQTDQETLRSCLCSVHAAAIKS